MYSTKSPVHFCTFWVISSISREVSKDVLIPECLHLLGYAFVHCRFVFTEYDVSSHRNSNYNFFAYSDFFHLFCNYLLSFVLYSSMSLFPPFSPEINPLACFCRIEPHVPAAFWSSQIHPHHLWGAISRSHRPFLK